jgi:DHA1 family tetracycline resistance protein-like MFS transporter
LAKIWFIFVTILLDAVGIGLLIPVMPDVLRRFSSDPTFVSEHYGYFIGAYALMQFFASPVLGSLSDRFGRKPILLVSLLGAGLDYVFMALAPTLPLLYLGRVISGLTGASMTVASSYMADISDEKTRSQNFGMIGAAWGIGFIAGPMLGGLLGGLGAAAPFFAAAALNLLNFLFGAFVLPESLPKEHRRDIALRKLNPLASIARVLKPSPIVGLVWIYFLLFVAGNVHPVNWTLYSQLKFGWNTFQVGLSLTCVGIASAVVQGALAGKIIPKLGERRALTVGIVIYVFGYFLFGAAPAGWMMYPILVVFAFSGIAMPALQSIVAGRVPPNEQGELQGSLVSLGSVASIIAPALYTYLFVTFTKPEAPIYFPGAAYVGASVICAFTLLLRFAIKPPAAVAPAP